MDAVKKIEGVFTIGYRPASPVVIRDAGRIEEGSKEWAAVDAKIAAATTKIAAAASKAKAAPAPSAGAAASPAAAAKKPAAPAQKAPPAA